MLSAARLAVSCVVLLGLNRPLAAQPATLNEAVVKFCKDNVGKEVGKGECAHLVSEAYKLVGAKPFSAFKDSPGKDDYVWGDLVYLLEVKGDKRTQKKTEGTTVKPGDVIQFRNARFQGKNYFSFCLHHTAVIVEVKEQDKVWVVLEQNANGKRFVVENTYRLDDLRAGWVRVYQPVAK